MYSSRLRSPRDNDFMKIPVSFRDTRQEEEKFLESGAHPDGCVLEVTTDLSWYLSSVTLPSLLYQALSARAKRAYPTSSYLLPSELYLEVIHHLLTTGQLQ